MKFSTLFVFTLLGVISLYGEDKGLLIFSDDFERSESQEVKDEPGNGWETNSKKRAKGDKQVDLKDGAMHIYISPKADHGVSVTHEAEFLNGSVEMRFILLGEKDVLGLNFADLKCKEVWAGHLFAARIGTSSIKLQDLKTGPMNLKLREAKQSKTLSSEQKALLKTKELTFKNVLETGVWHKVVASVKGDVLSVAINGKEVATMTSEGIAHPTKRMLRLAIPHKVIVDDLKIWKKG